MKTNNVLISVIIPCYNAELYLKEALCSITNQSYKELEIIILNDGSSDKTLSILEESAKKDNRIKLINNHENIGLIKTLNKGIKQAKGVYIARMDADDISNLNRIELQKQFLEDNCLDLVSSGFTIINPMGKTIGKSFLKSTQPNSCLFQSFFSNPIAHPLLLAKSEVLKSNFYGGENTKHSEDFELWNRLALKGYKIGNMKSDLLKYRKSESSISNKFEELQIHNHNIISKKNIERFFGFKISDRVISVINNRITVKNRFLDLFKAHFFLKKMALHLKKTKITNEEIKEINQVFIFQVIDIIIQSIIKHSFKLKVGGVILLIFMLPKIIMYGGLSYINAKL